MSVFAPLFVVFTATLAAAAAPDGVGKAVYDGQCAVCHGIKGDGQGSIAYLLSPRPRDFTRGVFKFRSTPTGSMPTDDDLLRTITLGVPGTSMPSWKHLPDNERGAVVQFIKTFSEAWTKKASQPSLVIGQAPDCAPLLKRGADMYGQAFCGQCHGPGGKGDGPSAPTLVDESGWPIRPYDFTSGGRMKGGSDLRDIYRTFSTGLSGTPMPAYQGTYPDNDLWALACHVQDLGKNGAPPPTASAELVVARAGLPATGTPDASVFANAAPATLPLRALYARAGAPDSATLRAVSDGQRVAFMVEWADSVADASPLRHEEFRDGVAIEFPVSGGGAKTFHGMGMHDQPVNIWHWKADWQLEVAAAQTLGGAYPGRAVDMYPAPGDATFVTAGASGNLMPMTRRSTPVEDLNAVGPGTLTTQPVAEQNILGTGTWSDGRWRVVFVRDLVASFKGDADVRSAGVVAVAVWDGAARDRNGQKSVSEWMTIRFEGSR